jgi:hypothetical protein
MPKDGVLGEGGSKIEAELLEIFGLRKNDYFYSYANKTRELISFCAPAGGCAPSLR